MKDIPSSPGGRKIRAWVAEGEHELQDFKLTISDARKIARSISAFANRGGGRLLIGVKDNGVIAGVRNEEDVFVVEQAASRYCSPAQDVSFHAYTVDTHVTVIVASVPEALERPVEVLEADGQKRAYVRVADENILAHPLMVRGWRLRARSAPGALSIGRDESRILSYLAEIPEHGVDERDIAVALHLSLAGVNRMLESLAALGLLNFTFDGTRFRLAPTSL
ncbi:MAG: ATP-binding protein [Muribaculaceae bacterium]|nr:ATP-binding protein [Muribaculaceae bacterium]